MPDVQPTLIRLPEELYERLRRESYETHTPQNTIVIKALEEYFKQNTPEK